MIFKSALGIPLLLFSWTSGAQPSAQIRPVRIVAPAQVANPTVQIRTVVPVTGARPGRVLQTAVQAAATPAVARAAIPAASPAAPSTQFPTSPSAAAPQSAAPSSPSTAPPAAPGGGGGGAPSSPPAQAQTPPPQTPAKPNPSPAAPPPAPASVAPSAAPAGNQDKGCDVVVDCQKHKVTYKSNPAGETIDCGKTKDKGDPLALTYNGVGRIGNVEQMKFIKSKDGALHDTLGIDGIPGMGRCGATSGEAKVFHNLGHDPAGNSNSNGCIHLSLKVLADLKQCTGSTLTITGATPPESVQPPPTCTDQSGGTAGAPGPQGITQ